MKTANAEAGFSKPSLYSVILLILVIVVVFVIPILPQSSHKVTYNIFFSILYLIAAMSMDRGRRIILGFAVGSIMIEAIGLIMDLTAIVMLSRIISFLFFIMIVIGLIIQIARTKRVTARVIIESISGYLLLGIVFMLIVAVVMRLNPEAFSFPQMEHEYGTNGHYVSEYMYYAFVTFTTLGYGDVVPKTPYAKSIATFASVCGQIYLTVIIAMLVGKFLSHSQEAK